MTTPVWSPGTIYNPGALVRPRSASSIDIGELDNAGFEDGDLTSWDFTITGGGGTPSVQSTHKFSGTYSVLWTGGAGSGHGGGIECELIHEERAAVTAGQSLRASCYIMYNPGGYTPDSQGRCRIYWYDASDVFISYTDGTLIHQNAGANRWALSTASGIAPPNAAFASIGAWLTADGGDTYADAFSWNYAFAGVPAGLIFRAVQADAGFSGSAEPTWPAVLGNTVVDNEVTWEAVATSRVTWEAEPILKSGAVEPTWPTLPGGTVEDNDKIAWVAISRRVEDERCPNTRAVMIAASKIFAVDADIIAFSATVNPLDWSTINDAGYLPFGLQAYGSNPAVALGLYRSNLAAFNSEGFQLWQVDQDPANMALLDAGPVSCIYDKTLQPVANDLAFLSVIGVRNMNIAGASTNLQSDGVGEPIDPLVQAEIEADEYEPFSLFWPKTGQHWTIFGPQAFVLTVNGVKDKSWSRYVFPEAITDWTLDGSDLYLRTETGKVWRVAENALQDDVYTIGEPVVLSGSVDINGASLEWTEADPEGGPAIDHYDLYRSVGVGSTIFVKIAEISADDPREYEDSPLARDQTYNYRIVAVDTRGIPTPESNTVSLVGEQDEFFGDVVTLVTGDTGAIVEWSTLASVVNVEGGCAVSTGQIKFGTHSVRNPNSGGGSEVDGVVVTDSVNLDRWTFPGEFTIEGWFFPVSIGGVGIEQLTALVTNSANLGPDRYGLEITNNASARVIRFRRDITVICSSANNAITTGAWQHIAVTRDSLGVIRIFVGGNVVASGTNASSLGGVDEFGDAKLNIAIGVAGQVDDFDTYFDQVRVTKGECRYAANFTPPTQAFPKG